MTRRDKKQIASILPDGDAEGTAYKLTAILHMAGETISGKTAAIEQECPLFGGNGPSTQQDLFQTGDEEQ